MEKNRLQEIISEEVSAFLEASMSRKFMRAVEDLQKIQLAQQKLRKAFVAEKDAKKKEKLKQDIIKMYKIVQKAESDFNSAIKSEPIDDIDEGTINEAGKTAKQYGLSDKFDDAVAGLKDKEFTTKGITNLAKKMKQDPKKALSYVKDAFSWLWKESKHEGLPLTESATDILADDIGGKVHDAFGGGTADARSTKKTFDDGVPVLKYIARAPKKRVKIPKKFKVVVDEKYGWYYYFDKGTWYGIDKKQYSTPPFDY